MNTLSSSVAVVSPNMIFGWNPNVGLDLNACPSLVDVAFTTVKPRRLATADASSSLVSGVLGQRTCLTLDLTDLVLEIDLIEEGEDVSTTATSITCEGLAIATPPEMLEMREQITNFSCEDARFEVSLDGSKLRVHLNENVKLCPGCFIVGGNDNVWARYETTTTTTTTTTETVPSSPNLSPSSSSSLYCEGDAELAPPIRACNAEENANYNGEDITEGVFLASSADACCVACQENPNCNVWTYCTDEAGGCGLNEYLSLIHI